jgi:release factor glutamine methyltransferase
MQLCIQSLFSRDQPELVSTLMLDSSTARIEVQCLLQRALNVSRAYLIAHPEHILNKAEEYSYQALLQRRLKGEPIAYILGEREFFGLNFFVTADTLIPRPETELLVELALDRIVSKFRVLDLGTGSGAIALTIAHTCADTEVFACDSSHTALAVAQNNAHQLSIKNVHFFESNWFSSLSGQRFDIIVSNPPYIAIDDKHLSQGDVRFEPASALVSGIEGLDDIRHIILHASTYLNSEGWLLLEHGYDQSILVRELLIEAGYINVFSAKDISGIERCSGGQMT